VLHFDNSPDQTALGAVFKCNVLVNTNSPDDGALCTWQGGAIELVSSPSKELNVDEEIRVRDGMLRAKCPALLRQEECFGWPTSLDQKCRVAAPSSVITPVVFVTSPTVVGKCDDFQLDVSTSTGHGGRDWQAISVEWTTNTNSSSVQKNISAINMLYAVDGVDIVIGGDRLTSGVSYVITITMCNFLGKCGVGVHTLTRSSLSVPIVTLGQPSLTLSRSFSHTLNANAYISTCDEKTSAAHLNYAWTVYSGSDIDSSIVSNSKVRSKFRLAAYTLRIGVGYRVALSVSHAVTGVSSSAIVDIIVLPGSVKAVIAGGSFRSVMFNDTMDIAASSSYDEDKNDVYGVYAGLSFDWACVSTQKSGVCGGTLTASGDQSSVNFFADSLSNVGSQSTVTVTVYGADPSRFDSASVVVNVIPSVAPKITLSTPVRKIRAKESLKIYALLQVQGHTFSQWSVSDRTIDIKSVSLTPVSSDMNGGSGAFNLVLSPYALKVGATYEFTLSAGEFARSSITVNVVRPPQSGVLSILPLSGKELTDVFTFLTSKWIDTELPLSYSFGYRVSPLSAYLAVATRQGASKTASLLPAGKESLRNKIECEVRAFNILSAENRATVDVVVSALDDVSPQGLASLLENLLDEARDDASSDATNQVIAVGSSVLNDVNCSLAPECNALLRHACGKTMHTCGTCLDGHVGDEGDRNTQCFSLDQISTPSLNADSSCSDVSECTHLQECSAGFCRYMRKNCANDCSGHGECINEILSTGQASTAECRISDTTCTAVCRCEDGYLGTVCNVPAANMRLRQKNRLDLALALNRSVMNGDLSEDGAEDFFVVLAELGAQMDEFTTDTCEALLHIFSHLLEYIRSTGLSIEMAKISFPIIDICAGLSASGVGSTPQRRQLQGSSSGGGGGFSDSAYILDQYVSMQVSEMVEGQDDISSIQATVRSTVGVKSARLPFVLNIPRTTAEEAFGVIKSSIAFDFSASHGLATSTIVETASKLYVNGTDFLSQPLRITASLAYDASMEVQPLDCIVTIQTYTSFKSNVDHLIPSNLNGGNRTFISRCNAGDLSSYNYTCPDSGHVFNHTCTGDIETLTTQCPDIKTLPVCNVVVNGAIQSNLELCKVLSYTNTSVTCKCAIPSSLTRRRLATSTEIEQSGVLEVVAMSESTYDSFGDTIREADDITVGRLQDSLIVICMYGVMWGLGGLGLMRLMYLSEFKRPFTSKVAAKAKARGDAMDSEASSPQPQIRDRKVYLLGYLAEVLPSVFLSKGTALERLWTEILEHHRYAILFTIKGPNAHVDILRTGINMLTVQTMLMFLLAVIYDLEVNHIC
jgi:hypothetical protein